MADVTEKFIFDDSQAINSLEGLVKGLETLNKQAIETQQTMDKGSKKAGEEVAKANEKMGDAVQKTALSMREARAEALKAAKDYSIFGVSLGGISQKLSEAKNVLSLFRQGLIGSVAATKTQAEGIDSLTKVFGGGRAAISGFVQGMNLVRVAILSTGIGALLLAFGALITFFTKTNEGAEILEKKMAGLKAVFTVVTNSVAAVGKKIYEAFDNPKQAVIDLYEIIKKNLINRVTAIPGIFGAIGTAIKAAFTLNLDDAKKAIGDLGTSVTQFATGLDEKQQKGVLGYIKGVATEAGKAQAAAEKNWERQDNLYDQETAAILKISKLRTQLAQQRLVSDDTAKGYAERIEAAKKAVAIEAQIVDLQVSLAKRKASILNEENRLRGAAATDEERRAATEALAEAYQAEASAFKLKKSLANEVRALEKEQLDFINSKIDALKKYSDEIIKLGAEASFVTAEEERKKNLGAQLNILIEQRKQIQGISDAFFAATGIRTMNKELELSDKLIEKVTSDIERGAPIKIDPIPPTARQNIVELQRELERLKQVQVDYKIDTSKEQAKIQKSIRELESAPLQPLEKEVKINLKLVAPTNSNDGPDFASSINGFLEGVNNADELLQKSLDEIFGENNGKKAREFISGLQSAYSSYSSILTESLSIQIQANERLIQQRQEQRQKLEDELKYEQELQKEGLANNVGTKQEEVDNLLAEEERYRKENDILKKKAQKQALIADTIDQTSSLITSSINIIKGFSNIPIIGLPLGIAAVGALLTFFASTKAKAFAATKLHTGARHIDDYFGFADKHGDTDLHGGQGYKVINARTGKDTNVRISGREVLMREKVSLANEDFLLNMNKGLYDNIPLAEIVDNYRNLSSPESQQIINQTIIKSSGPTMQWVPFEINGRKGAVLKQIRADMAENSKIWFD